MNSQIYELMEQSIAETKRQLEALQRMERGEGSGALTGFAAAKRAAEPGGAEDLPQSLAVSPVKVSEAVVYMEKVAAGFDGYAWGHADRGHQNLAAFNAGVAAGWRSAAVVLPQLLTRPNEPESESSENAGDGLATNEAIEGCADSNNGTASGRRNVEPSYRDGEKE